MLGSAGARQKLCTRKQLVRTQLVELVTAYLDERSALGAGGVTLVIVSAGAVVAGGSACPARSPRGCCFPLMQLCHRAVERVPQWSDVPAHSGQQHPALQRGDHGGR